MPETSDVGALELLLIYAFEAIQVDVAVHNGRTIASENVRSLSTTLQTIEKVEQRMRRRNRVCW